MIKDIKQITIQLQEKMSVHSLGINFRVVSRREHVCESTINKSVAGWQRWLLKRTLSCRMWVG